MPDRGTIRLHQDDRSVTFMIEGWVTMAHALALRRFVERSLAGGATAVRLDLRHCTYMDSTFLGTLLVLQRALERHGQGQFVLVSPSERCRDLLRRMDLDAVFPIVSAAEPETSSWPELPGTVEDVDAFRRTIVQAHQELSRLAGPVSEAFRDVARRLGQEWGSEDSQ